MTRDPYALGRGNTPLCQSPVGLKPIRPKRREEMKCILATLRGYFPSEREAFEFCRRFAGVRLDMPPFEIVDELQRDRAPRS